MVSRILLADDSITIQKVVNLTFADEGIEVVAVSNGEMAARRLEEVNPDLVLADIFMPGKNGYELCEAIKTNAKFRNVPVVLLVGAFEPFDQVEARRVQADAHLTKPFESRTLVDTVRKLLGNTDRPHTGPLAAAVPVHQESSAMVEGHNSWLTSAQSGPTETLEFESASGRWTPTEMRIDEPGAQPPVAENIPTDLGQRAEETQTEYSSPEVSQVAPSRERQTGELASPPSAAEPTVHSVSAENQTLTAPYSHFEVQSASPAYQGEQPPPENVARRFTVDSPPANEFDQQQMVVDFEESLSAKRDSYADAMIDLDASGVEATEEGSGSVAWQMEPVHPFNGQWTTPNKVNLNTTKLEMPDLLEGDGGSLEAKREDAAVFSFSEAPAIGESAALFTAEEPLGDVLFDSGNSEPLRPSRVYGFPLEDSTTTEFTLELSPDEVTQGGQITAPHTARVTGELVTAELPAEGQKLVESEAAQDFAAREPQPLAEAPEQWVSQEAQDFTVDESLADESLLDYSSPEVSASYDWTSPSQVMHSTGRLDSTIMPVELAKPNEALLHEQGFLEPAPSDEAPSEAVNWEAEQMRFAAIDLEASPVEEGAALDHSLRSSESERGFEISPAIVDHPAASLNENGHREAGETPVGPIELSPMVIDEIVRRVVAQIGDSIVREIAWEIIPDCVERIIEQQTRDALAKR